MTTLPDLIERLEKANGPDRELDLDIERALIGDEFFEKCAWISDSNKELGGQYHHADYGPIAPPQHFTESIDASLRLVPEHCDWLINGRCNYVHVWESKETGGHKAWECTNAPTPAIALCIAALRARQEEPAS